MISFAARKFYITNLYKKSDSACITTSYSATLLTQQPKTSPVCNIIFYYLMSIKNLLSKFQTHNLLQRKYHSLSSYQRVIIIFK